jgi:hypothetical protein
MTWTDVRPAVPKADSQYRHLQSILNFADLHA